MAIELDTVGNKSRVIKLENMEDYVTFRTQIPKPTSEEAHLKHILRFYMARAFVKLGYENIFILPKIKVGEGEVTVDVAAENDGKTIIAICEPESVTPETEEILKKLIKLSDLEIFIVHSQYGNSGNAETLFEKEIKEKKVRLMAVVPPPFDDVYEYDIWMFEKTFTEKVMGDWR